MKVLKCRWFKSRRGQDQGIKVAREMGQEERGRQGGIQVLEWRYSSAEGGKGPGWRYSSASGQSDRQQGPWGGPGRAYGRQTEKASGKPPLVAPRSSALPATHTHTHKHTTECGAQFLGTQTKLLQPSTSWRASLAQNGRPPKLNSCSHAQNGWPLWAAPHISASPALRSPAPKCACVRKHVCKFLCA